jgi:porphobilinogen synthase
VSTFPVTRLRRLRSTGALRDLVRETTLGLDDLVQPLFVAPEALPNDRLPPLSRHTVEGVVRECELDVAEGADVLMVKPALPYLDVIRAARERFELPLAAYSVSGEYAMLKAAAAAGDLDERAAAVEVLTSIRRAGADVVFTYWAKEFASWL